MDVAPCIDSHGFFPAALEVNLRLALSFDTSEFNSVLHLQAYEHYMVSVLHRMIDTADVHPQRAVIQPCDVRQMFLRAIVLRLWLELHHLLTTAYRCHSGILNHENNVSAAETLIKYYRHNSFD